MGEGNLWESEEGPGDPGAEEQEERVHKGAAEGRTSEICEDRGDGNITPKVKFITQEMDEGDEFIYPEEGV